MKRIIAVLMAFSMLFALASCGSNAKKEATAAAAQTTVEAKTTIKVAALKGPTGIGMTNLMDKNDKKSASNNYNFTILGSPDEIVAKIVSGEVDVAACPTNLAAVLYNKTNGKIQIAAINTLGVLYILENGNTIKSVKDLKGKTIVTSGQGAVPEYALNYILKQNGLDPSKDVKIEYKAEHSEVASLAAAGKADICMLPEPNVTAVLMQNKKFHIALDLTKEWKNACKKSGNADSELAMGCIVVRKDFAEKNKHAFNSFLTEYRSSVGSVTADPKAASVLVQKYGILPKAAIAEKAIPNCNITYIDGTQMKSTITDLFSVMFKANPKSIGGKLPNEDFYYSK